MTSPRTLAARRLGYACVILIALVARDAVAQRTISVTLLPGESTKSIQAPGDANFVVSLTTPVHLCDLPTTAPVINGLLLNLVSRGELQQALTRMESAGTASDFAIANGFSALTARDPKRYIFVGGSQSFSQTEFHSTATRGTDTIASARQIDLSRTFATACLTVDEARGLLNIIRRSIRAYLGLPALAN